MSPHTSPEPLAERYLGDGVYASFDGQHVKLDLRGQPDSNLLDEFNAVALEPSVYSELVRFVNGLPGGLFPHVDALTGGRA